MSKFVLNEDTLLVMPIDADKLSAEITERLSKSKYAKEHTKYSVSRDGVIPELDNILIDDECCYGQMPLSIYTDGDAIEVDYMVEVTVFRKTQTEGDFENGYGTFESKQMSITIPMSKLRKYLLPAIPLREFMGSRYNYNPRIKSNMRDMIENLGEYVMKQREINEKEAEDAQAKSPGNE